MTRYPRPQKGRKAARAARGVHAETPVVLPSSYVLAGGAALNKWLSAVGTLLSVALLGVTMMAIPYGAPMPIWYFVGVAVLGTAVVTVAFADRSARLRSVVWWPVPVIIGAFGASAAASDFPTVAFERSWTMALYAVVFVAAQIACKTMWGRKAIVLAVLAVITTVAVDFWWQRHTGISLVREVRLLPVRWSIAPGLTVPDGVHPWKNAAPSGSLGNVNDQAVIPILLPLLMMTVPSAWAWCLYVVGLGSGSYLAIAGLSRQVMLGLITGVGALLALRSRSTWRWWLAGTGLLVVGAVCLINPDVRARILLVAEAPLGDRGLPVAYGIDLYGANPVVGIGPTLFGHYYVKGVRERWTFLGEPLAPVGMPWVHCVPVEIACELGTIGLLAFGSVSWGCVRHLRSAFCRGGEARNVAVAVTASALSMAAIALVDLSFAKEWVQICWWLVIGLGYASSSFVGHVDMAPCAAPARRVHGC